MVIPKINCRTMSEPQVWIHAESNPKQSWAKIARGLPWFAFLQYTPRHQQITNVCQKQGHTDQVDIGMNWHQNLSKWSQLDDPLESQKQCQCLLWTDNNEQCGVGMRCCLTYLSHLLLAR
jgi:hypothetical protein